MRAFKCTVFLVILLLASALPATSQLHTATVDYYELGSDKLAEGDWELALRIWYQGTKTPGQNDANDPRIAFSFIQTATAKKSTRYYSIAHQLYFQSLTPEVFNNYPIWFIEEAEKIIPIAGKKTRDILRKKIHRNDPTLVHDIRAFWENEDPVLSTEINERLIEHWERINEARQRFTLNQSSVYDTDDRGTIYVRFGPPRRIHSDRLSFDHSLFRSKASELIDLLNPPTGLSADTSFSTFSTGNGIYNKNAQLINLENKAREFFKSASYEVWLYNGDPNNANSSLFIFGEDDNSGKYRLLNSIEDMIPNRAFGIRGDQARTTGTSISAGLILQLVAYHQLSHIDPFFLNVATQMESRLFSNVQNNSMNLDLAARNRNEFELSRIQSRLPAGMSSLRQELTEIEIKSSAYRMLNNNNEPTLLLAFRSRPQRALIARWLNQHSMSKTLEFDLIHSAKPSISTPDDSLFIQSDTAAIYYSEFETPENNIESTTSLFLVPNTVSGNTQIAAELFQHLPDSIDTSSISLFGLGRKSLFHPEPLNTNTEELEMSDLIIGYRQTYTSSLFLPFVLSLDNKIPAGENLVVHFEVYHLQTDANTPTSFTLEYQMTPKRKGLSRLFRGPGKSSVRLTLEYTATGSMFRENLEIKTEAMKPGHYELELLATDPVNGSKSQRTIGFEIVDQNNK